MSKQSQCSSRTRGWEEDAHAQRLETRRHGIKINQFLSHEKLEGQIGISKFSKTVPKLDAHKIQKTVSKDDTECRGLAEEKKLQYSTKGSLSMSPSVLQRGLRDLAQPLLLISNVFGLFTSPL